MPLSYAPKKAMVFAAGFGKRMRPITDTLPKPLVKVGGKPMLDHALDKLADAGVTEAVVNTHYLAKQIHEHIEERAHTNPLPEVTISHELEILETGGGIVRALPLLGDEPFYTVNSDVVWVDRNTPSFVRLAEKWDPEKMDALLLLHPVERAIGYDGDGNFDVAADGQLLLQKDTHKPYVFTGAMIIKPQLFSGLKEEPFSLFRGLLFHTNIEPNGTLKRMYGLIHDGDWLHVGSPDGLAKAKNYFSKIKPISQV
jgi:MurNAc alpha-1-phosphate uridylyltransferase